MDRAVGADRQALAQLLLGLRRTEREHDRPRRRAASTIRTASSTPHSSCGLIVKPRWSVRIACSSSVSTIFPPVMRHALHADQEPHERMRVFSGSKIGAEPTKSTVTG